VQASYLDVNQRPQATAPESLLAVLRTLGVPVTPARDVPAALREAPQARVLRVNAAGSCSVTARESINFLEQCFANSAPERDNRATIGTLTAVAIAGDFELQVSSS